MYDRSERLRELFKETIVELLREVKDPGLSGFLTVTDVELSVDRKNLKVFYSILGSEKEKAHAAAALERAAPYVRGLLKKKVTIKVIPNITFHFDETPGKASRIDALLNKLEKEKGQ